MPSNATRYPENNKGVTLVELIIALVVLLLVFMGVMQSALLSIDHNLRNLLREEAIAIADERMSEMKNTPVDSLIAGTTCQIVQRNFRNASGQFTICDNIANLDAGVDTKSIEIVVGWDHKKENTPLIPTNREFQHSITTVRRK
ncbi:MAG: prepilin-type N-terminal cleavage/methylation domain-containing protein [Nitrospirota bacterium]